MNKFITIFFLTSTLFLAGCGGSDVEQAKERALEMCDTQMATLSDSAKEAAMKTCKCIVENTDYDAVRKLTAAGELEEAGKLAMETSKKCS